MESSTEHSEWVALTVFIRAMKDSCQNTLKSMKSLKKRKIISSNSTRKTAGSLITAVVSPQSYPQQQEQHVFNDLSHRRGECHNSSQR